jgi:hypothetical protein
MNQTQKLTTLFSIALLVLASYLVFLARTHTSVEAQPGAEVWRYEIIPAARTGSNSGGNMSFNTTYENMAFLLDTATGKVWWKYEHLLQGTSTGKFSQLQVDPAPSGSKPVPNHFKIYHNDSGSPPYFYLVDTTNGQTWQFISVSDKQKNIDFTGFAGIAVDGRSFGPGKK